MLQFRKENEMRNIVIPKAVKVKETEEITEKGVRCTLTRAITFFSSLQAHDGHWPAESASPLFFLPPLVSKYY